MCCGIGQYNRMTCLCVFSKTMYIMNCEKDANNQIPVGKKLAVASNKPLVNKLIN